jgi:NAD(P)-dependent dehydrogenase (short-subunit alcohol dehydrogenase family)
MDLKGKVAIVTGAGVGIGRGIAELFALKGAAVVIADINPKTGKQVVEGLKKKGCAAMFSLCDVGKETQVKSTISKTISTYKRIDVLVNNAGYELWKPLAETSSKEWDALTSVDLKGVFLFCRHVIPQMKKQGGGSIVNVASIQAICNTGSVGAYVAAKGGVRAMTHSMALDYAKFNIRVNAISPGTVRTTMWDRFANSRPDPREVEQKYNEAIPLGRIGEPTDIAYGALYLASDYSRWVTGINLVIDGGMLTRAFVPQV